jgi:PhoPQ-activated pathogenicity-related protein
MDSLSTLVTRGSALLAVRDDDDKKMSTTMIDLLIALLVLVFVSLCLIGALYGVRKVRRNRAIARQSLPQYNDVAQQGHRRLTITATPYAGRNSSIYVYDEKSSMMDSPTTPTSPVPEIRITFPDEQDESGRRKSGRVVVVRVGETTVGLEPLSEEEQLPAYEKENGERFHSIDMDRIGGLKEKDQYS